MKPYTSHNSYTSRSIFYFTSRIVFPVLALLAFAVTPAHRIHAQSADILRAMRDELARSMKELTLPELERPYYMQYTVTDQQQYDVRASFGSVTESKHTKNKRLNVAVRVGSPQFDNTNFFDPALGFFGSSDDEERFRNRQIPYELDYNALRRELWLASDAAYKQTAELFAKKQAALKNRVRLDTVPDFTIIPPAKALDTSVYALFDRAYFERLAQDLSSVFRDFPTVSLSNVTIQYMPETTYFVNSEGREYARTTHFMGVEMLATAQAKDGMPLAQMFTVYAKRPSDLPSRDSLLKAARILASTIARQTTASVAASYSGPVLFEGQAAAEAFIQGFAPNLVTQRSPITERGVSDNPRFSAFQNKIGGRVMPEFLSVEVKPSLTNAASAGGTTLVGAYKFDDDGVAAESFTIVKNGYLKGLMSSRTPTRRVRTTNGHSRGGAAFMSVLELSVDKLSEKQRALPAAKLRQKLLQLCKDRELPYGIVVRRVLNQNILFYNLYSLTDGEFPFAKGDGNLTTLEAYKIYPDGREELLRGCDIAGLTVSAFKDIVAVGNQKFAYNCLAQAVTSPFFSGGSQFVAASVIVPALLFEDMEVKPVEDDFAKPPIVPHPFFSASKK
jgi:predicted Zn-dependent protease